MVESAPAAKVVVLKSARDWLRELLDRLPDPPLLRGEEAAKDSTVLQSFHPDRDSAADAIMRAEEVYKEMQEWEADGAIDFPADQAFEWMHKIVGLNFYEVERRWKEFGSIIVPGHLSDQYGLEARRGLFASLTQIRLAYIIGADLAAIALCRSVTERLIRFHYAYDIPNARESKKTKLTGEKNLIEQVEHKFPFLQNFDLSKKVKQAHSILHDDETDNDIEHREPDRGLVVEWLSVLKDMIREAPDAGATTP